MKESGLRREGGVFFPLEGQYKNTLGQIALSIFCFSFPLSFQETSSETICPVWNQLIAVISLDILSSLQVILPSCLFLWKDMLLPWSEVT